jgi:hypothetical protein
MRHSALYRAVKHGNVINVRRLLAAGCDANETFGAYTILALAAARGNTPIIQLLLNAGAEPTYVVVQAAAFGNHARAVRLLLAAGGPVHSLRGDTPLLNASAWSAFSREQQRRVRRLLREAGARELPAWYLHWRWAIKYGWRWRLRRLLYSVGSRRTSPP